MTEATQEQGSYSSKNARTVAVTVTYGARKQLLCTTLDALRDLGLKRVVVVNNGASWNVASEFGSNYPDLVEVINLNGNTGSANGYAVGIDRACSMGADFIWLLDDDNRPHPDALSQLLQVYARERQTSPADQLAVLAFRPEHQNDVAVGVATHRINPRRSSFRGFHVFDIWYKLWRRTPWGLSRQPNVPPIVRLDTAPYSGLLLHRSLIAAIGLPRTDFVLYGDDTEYTYRITRNGGKILLVTDALIEDLESSWNVKERFGNSFSGLLHGEGDFRAYYAMRNGTFLDAHCLPKNAVMFWINRHVFMSILSLLARLQRRVDRFQLLSQAVSDGMAGRLGIHSRFPL